MTPPILIRGGGDLASGIALRLSRAGFPVIITELPQPLAVRRAVSFAEAVYTGEWEVEGISARRVHSVEQARDLAPTGIIPVLIAPELDTVTLASFPAVIDARLIKQPASYPLTEIPLIIGIGPGFTAGENCHALVETQRGHTLGRVYWRGSALTDTGQPEGDPHRVLRATLDGLIENMLEIGEHVEEGTVVTVIKNQTATNEIKSPFKGVVRGLIHSGLNVSKGLKIGDIDPRDNRDYCFLASDKALAIGGGVIEAMLNYNNMNK